MGKERPVTLEEELAYQKAHADDLPGEKHSYARDEGLSRRDFLKKVLKPAFLLALPVGGGLATAQGAFTVWTSEQEATELHPNERMVDNELGAIIGDLESAKNNLTYYPAHYEPELHESCSTDEDGGRHCSTYTTQRYVPPDYPSPKYSKGRISSALNNFNRISKFIESKNTLEDTLKSVDSRLPNVDTETVNSDKYVKERGDLQTTIDWCRQYKDRNNKILYAEVATKRNVGFLELIGGPAALIVGGILYIIHRRDKLYDEEE